MKENRNIHEELIADALDLKFSKNSKLNQKIVKRIKGIKRKSKGKKVDPVDVFAFSAEDTLLVIKRNNSQKIRHLFFLDSNTEEPFHIQNIRNFKLV